MSLKKALKRIREAKEKKATVLDLSELNLTEIPSEIGELAQLNVLYLSSNQISEIRGLENLPRLRELYLSSNRISEIRGLENLPQLSVLYLDSNQISEIPKSLLDLDQTIYWLLPEENDYQDGIYLKNNPLSIPPPEIVQKGNATIRAYLEELEAAKKPLNEVKVILVGEGASGKTSLVKRILDQGFDSKEQQTDGINISKETFTVKRQKLAVNFWDFGGQEIMHSTHQFFLTKRCLYLLVLDSRRDEKAEYWLKYVQSFGGEAPVIVVLNKIDENPSYDVNREFLSTKYPNIRAYYKVSCKSNRGIRSLKKDLLAALWNLELRNSPFPRNWFRVKAHFQAMTEDYISYKEYEEVCIKHQVAKPEAQKTLLGFLNDLGIVLNYDELKWHNTQVLNPLWLTNAVYRIINSPKMEKAKGRLNVKQLDSIINDEKYLEAPPPNNASIFLPINISSSSP